MRDPKTHAKVLARRWEAARDTRDAARDASNDRLDRLWGRLVRATRRRNSHADRTGWLYTPPRRGNPGFWTYTEIDTEETHDA